MLKALFTGLIGLLAVIAFSQVRVGVGQCTDFTTLMPSIEVHYPVTRSTDALFFAAWRDSTLDVKDSWYVGVGGAFTFWQKGDRPLDPKLSGFLSYKMYSTREKTWTPSAAVVLGISVTGI